LGVDICSGFDPCIARKIAGLTSHQQLVLLPPAQDLIKYLVLEASHALKDYLNPLK